MAKNNISIIILAGNEEQVIKDCLLSCRWADQIILVAANSTDQTKTIAQKTIKNINIVETNDEYNKNFSKWRNLGYQAATKPWHLYIDSDERIPFNLKQEILIITNQADAKPYYVIPRANHYLGHRVRHGGSYPDYVKRLYQASSYSGWTGQLHEQPVLKQPDNFGYLKNDLLHFTHRDLSSMLKKTIVWTDLEAEALYKSGHPPVVWWRFPRMMLTKLWERLIKQSMWRDGVVGWISVIFEMFNTFIIYARLWEKQHQNH